MTVTSFVKNCIDKIVSAIPYVKCTYEYHALSHTHFIEVVPHSTYRTDKKYIDFEEKIVNEFEEKYFGEYICFITSDSIHKITSPIYSNKGYWYTPKVNYYGMPPISPKALKTFTEYLLREGNIECKNFVYFTNLGRGCKIDADHLKTESLETEIKNIIETPYGVSLILTNIAA